MSWLKETLGRLREGRVGFRMDEVMSGEHEFEDGFGPAGKRPMAFRVIWGVEPGEGVGARIEDRALKVDLHGTVTIDGLCHEEPCTGFMELRYLRDHSIRYVFDLEVEGRPYRYVGEKVNIRLHNLPWSHTTCYGRLVQPETGALVSTSVTHFRLRTIPAFVASLRLSGYKKKSGMSSAPGSTE